MNTKAIEIFSAQKDESQVHTLVEKYPWCPVLQLSLLHTYKKNNSLQFEMQAEKAALFFNNPQWLHLQVTSLLAEEETKKNLPEEKNINLKAENENAEKTIAASEIFSEPKINETEFTFEPLHTTDYFASQGIKVTDEPVTNDKLANQMKSFTEWLKSMKKIHNEKLSENDVQTDKAIQQIAEHSNTDTAVVTEAMADVLIKQNKMDKAIELYRKLSLINPSKSAYFAAKIDSLRAADKS